MAYILLLFYTALLYIRPQDIYAVPGEVPAFSMLTVAAGFLFFFAMVTRKLNPQSLLGSPQNKLIVLFLVAIALSHLAQFRFMGAWQNILFFINVVVLFLLITCVLDTHQKIKGYITLLVLLTLFLAYQGILQSETGTAWGGHPPFIHNGEVRVQWIGTFSDPNDFALALVIMVPPLLFIVVSKRVFFQKGLAVFLLFVFIYAIFLTRSRGGYLSLAGVFFLFFAMRYRGIKFAIMGMIALSSILMLAPPRLMASLTGGSFVDYGRVDAWSAGLQMIKSHPLFGVGRGRFDELHDLAAHSAFVQVLAETGILGSFCWIGLFYITLRDIYQTHQFKSLGQLEDPYDMDETGVSLLIALFGFLLGAFFLSKAYTVLPFILIATWVATARQIERENEGLKFRFKRQDTAHILGLVIGLIVFLYISVRFFWSAK
ncbi:MAG: O-antigen ligase family protein [Nitrospirota bacterium]